MWRCYPLHKKENHFQFSLTKDEDMQVKWDKGTFKIPKCKKKKIIFFYLTEDSVFKVLSGILLFSPGDLSLCNLKLTVGTGKTFFKKVTKMTIQESFLKGKMCQLYWRKIPPNSVPRATTIWIKFLQLGMFPYMRKRFIGFGYLQYILTKSS